MQNEMDELDPDHHTVYLKADQPMYPCTAVAERYKGQCYLMQTSHALRLAGYNFSPVFRECRAIEARYRDVCYQSMGRDASGNTSSNVARTKADCMLGPNQESRGNCITGAVKDFVSFYHGEQQATRLCDGLHSSLRAGCQDTKMQFYREFH